MAECTRLRQIVADLIVERYGSIEASHRVWDEIEAEQERRYEVERLYTLALRGFFDG